MRWDANTGYRGALSSSIFEQLSSSSSLVGGRSDIPQRIKRLLTRWTTIDRMARREGKGVSTRLGACAVHPFNHYRVHRVPSPIAGPLASIITPAFQARTSATAFVRLAAGAPCRSRHTTLRTLLPLPFGFCDGGKTEYHRIIREIVRLRQTREEFLDCHYPFTNKHRPTDKTSPSKFVSPWSSRSSRSIMS